MRPVELFVIIGIKGISSKIEMVYLRKFVFAKLISFDKSGVIFIVLKKKLQNMFIDVLLKLIVFIFIRKTVLDNLGICK